MKPENSTKENAAYINITPLIDILLVLLIIFMVVSPLKPARFETKLPAEPDDSPAQTNPNRLIVTVDSRLRVGLNDRENLGTVDDTSRLAALLAETLQRREQNGIIRRNASGATEIEKTVVIKAPRSISYGEIVKVVDGVKATGANPVGLQIDDLQN